VWWWQRQKNQRRTASVVSAGRVRDVNLTARGIYLCFTTSLASIYNDEDSVCAPGSFFSNNILFIRLGIPMLLQTLFSNLQTKI
jgi:hypothetical protein